MWYYVAMFKFDDKEIQRYEREIKAYAHKAFPFVTKNTLNKAAFRTQKIARKDVRVKMVLRNNFTERSIQVNKVEGLNVRTQKSSVGSTLDYMLDQEFGTVITKTGSRGVSIPTGFSAGQQGSQPRTRLPRLRNTMRRIRLKGKNKRMGKTRKQRLLRSVQEAVNTGNRFVFLDLGRRQGIFKVVGGRKGVKRGWPKNAQLKMVHDMTSQSVTIPKNPWLEPAWRHGIIGIPDDYKDALLFQINRFGLFK